MAVKTYQVELKIVSIGAGGDGVAFHKGKKIFIPFVCEGETALIEVNQDKGRIIKIIEASPQRQKPPCPYFTKCGGCSMQHINNNDYLAFKKNMLEDTLKYQKIAVVVAEKTIQPPISSRRRAEFVFAKLSSQNIMFGFNQKRSHNIININHCLLLRAEINQIINPLKLLCSSFADKQRGDIKITFAANGLNIVFKLEKEPNWEALENMALFAQEHKVASLGYTCLQESNFIPVAVLEPPVTEFSGYHIPLPNDCFLQPSKEGEDFLTSVVMSESKDVYKALDVFSGLGVFSFALVKAGVKKVEAFDVDAKMIAALNNGAKKNNLSNITAKVRDLFRSPLSDSDFDNVDLVVIDPPRAGANAQVISIANATKKPPKIIMISCNPATFARDAQTLIRGGYCFAKLISLDQFAYSPHLEIAGVFLLLK